MFNFNNKNEGPNQYDLEDLEARLAHLERKCRRLEARIEELEDKADSMNSRSDAKEEPQERLTYVTKVSMPTDDDAQEEKEVRPTTVASVSLSFSDEPSEEEEEPKVLDPNRPRPVYYLAAPSADGTFSRFSRRLQIGKTIYVLKTNDGVNGTFILYDSPDAIATAMLSVSQFIKPVCKVNGSVAQYPRHIVTEEEGLAIFEDDVWKVVRKAVVRFE